MGGVLSLLRPLLVGERERDRKLGGILSPNFISTDQKWFPFVPCRHPDGTDNVSQWNKLDCSRLSSDLQTEIIMFVIVASSDVK